MNYEYYGCFIKLKSIFFRFLSFFIFFYFFIKTRRYPLGSESPRERGPATGDKILNGDGGDDMPSTPMGTHCHPYAEPPPSDPPLL